MISLFASYGQGRLSMGELNIQHVSFTSLRSSHWYFGEASSRASRNLVSNYSKWSGKQLFYYHIHTIHYL